MSRHRNVRSMNYSEEYEGYDDVYGHSVEDDYTISPSDAAFMYDRTVKPQMSAFFTEDDIAEEDENVEVSSEKRCSDPNIDSLQHLSEVDRVRVQSCLDEIRNVIGDSIPEPTVIKKVLACDFDVNKTLDAVLSEATANSNTQSTGFCAAEVAPPADKDDKITSLHNLEKNLKRVSIGQDSAPLSNSRLNDIAASAVGADVEPIGFGSNVKDRLDSLRIPRFGASVSCPTESRERGNLAINLSEGLPIFPLMGKSGKLNIPSFGSDVEAGETVSSFGNMQPDLNVNESNLETPLSLSALAAQHQSNMVSEHEHSTLSSLAAEHLRNTTDRSQSRFFIPRLTSPPAKKSEETERAFSPVFRGDSPIEPISAEPIDLLSALNPPESRTNLELPRVTWMETDDEDNNDIISCLPDPTCLLDRVSQGTDYMQVDSPLSTDLSSPLGRVLGKRMTAKHTFSFKIAARYEGNVQRFLFDCPSPDDCILIRLGRKLPS